MKHFRNHSLKDLTTLGVGGAAENFYQPESKEELLDTLVRLGKEGKDYYLLGNGSNLLLSDGVIRKPVIGLKHALAFSSIEDSGDITAGASLDIRKLINDCANRGLRAPVELLTVPATVGGAIYMNAGRTTLGIDISQTLVEVEVFDGTKTFVMAKEECGLGHRRSVFHDRKDLTILSAKFHFPPTPKDVVLAARKHSLDQGADKCYRTEKSAGSVFKKCDMGLMRKLMGVKFGDATFAPKTANCILNTGNARYYQVIALVRLAQFLHLVRRKPCVLEWEIWK